MHAAARDNTITGTLTHTMFVIIMCAFAEYSYILNVLDYNSLISSALHSRIVLHAASSASTIADANSSTSAYAVFITRMHAIAKYLHMINILHCNELKSPTWSLIFYTKKV